MLEQGQVSNRQAAFLLCITVVLATAILFVPAITAAQAKHNGWLSLLFVATTYGLLVTMVIIKLGRRFPSKTIIEFAPLALGLWPGKIIAAAYVLWFIHFNAVIVREFGDFLDSAFMPETPVIAFNIMLLLLAAWGVKGGIEVICRANEFIFPLALFSLIFIMLIVTPDVDFANLRPVLDDGVKPVIAGGLAPSAFRGEIIVILMFLPYIKQSHLTGRYLSAAVIFIGLILAMDNIMTTAIMGELTEYLTFPTFELARFASLGRFFERVDALILMMWVTGVTIKVSVFYYAAALGTAQLFGLRDYRPVVLPLGLILAIMSEMLFDNTQELVVWISQTFPPYAYTFELIIPSLLLFIAVLRKKGEKSDVV